MEDLSLPSMEIDQYDSNFSFDSEVFSRVPEMVSQNSIPDVVNEFFDPQKGQENRPSDGVYRNDANSNHYQQGHQMQLRVYYKHIPIRSVAVCGQQATEDCRHDISDPAGFTIYHNRCCPDLLDSVLKFELPPFKPWMVQSLGDQESEYIMAICKGMEIGLHVEYHDGSIYATRYCTGHVYYWTHELGVQKAVKLERKQKTLVFNFQKFFTRINSLAGNWEAIVKEKRPVIVFMFGQQWHTGMSLKKMLVHAEVTPIEAVKLLNGVTTGRCEIKSIPKSVDEGGIKRPIEPPGASFPLSQ